MIFKAQPDESAAPHDDLSERVRRRRLLRAGRARRRILRSTAALPALFTILNGLAGFGAIHFAAKDALGQASMANLTTAAWLIFAAMVCDMLDGRLARFARRTSDFGAQLDSLCDIVSFGVAPAMLMLRAGLTFLGGNVEGLQFLAGLHIERILWCVAGAYLACAALRLARFNVENEPDESAHMWFKGLPSPGAAACVATLTLLFADLVGHQQGWQSRPWALLTVGVALPIVTFLCALLMVSNFRYAHIVNQYIRGKRSFGYLVRMIILLMAACTAFFMVPYITAAAATVGYALSGPVRYLWRRLHGKTDQPPAAGQALPS